MARTKKPENLLKEAIAADDNLAILKAHRMLTVADLLKADEPSERTQISRTLSTINSSIIKLEGSKEEFPEDEQEAFDRADVLRKKWGG